MKTETGIQLWGGLECTVNRVGDRFHDQFEKSGHRDRPEDLDLVAGLGVKTLRYPVLWERTAPDRPDERDWRFADERLGRLCDLGVAPIAGLVHHGSGPRYTNLLDDSFAPGLAGHARAVAERFPWIDAYTPVNEPLTTARFSALYGHWYPHATDGRSFARALVNQVRATVLSMAAIRRVNPQAQLVQTDDLGKTHATQPLRYQADFDNLRRWLGWDLLCGRVDRGHPMWAELVAEGIEERELGWFLDNPCPPDVLGINYYLTSERFLDHRLDRYPPEAHGANRFESFADVEAVRVLAGGIDGPEVLLKDAWERYGLPIAITECHLGCTREEQVRWLRYVWNAAVECRMGDVDVRAVTVWSMFGAHDWCSLLTCDHNRYEPGVFDLRAPAPRPTALAATVRALAAGEPLPEGGDGWWERPMRLHYPAVVSAETLPAPFSKRSKAARPPLAILSDGEGLGREFMALCELRGLQSVLLHRSDLPMEDAKALHDGLVAYRPWAVVDAKGGREVGGRATEAHAGAPLALACRELRARLVVFCDDLAFDGRKDAPYTEADPAQGAGAEILTALPEALVVRTGPLFGPWDAGGFVQRAVETLSMGRTLAVPPTGLLSPTSMGDLVNACLDLLIDGMAGPIHLANEGSVTLADFARMVATTLGLPAHLVAEAEGEPVEGRGRFDLRSDRAWVMPTLDDALDRFAAIARLHEIARGKPYVS